MPLARIRSSGSGEVVRLLRELLAEAERGQITGIAIATCGIGTTGSAYEIGGGGVAGLVCAIERVKLRLLEHGAES